MGVLIDQLGLDLVLVAQIETFATLGCDETGPRDDWLAVDGDPCDDDTTDVAIDADIIILGAGGGGTQSDSCRMDKAMNSGKDGSPATTWGQTGFVYVR